MNRHFMQRSHLLAKGFILLITGVRHGVTHIKQLLMVSLTTSKEDATIPMRKPVFAGTTQEHLHGSGLQLGTMPLLDKDMLLLTV